MQHQERQRPANRVREWTGFLAAGILFASVASSCSSSTNTAEEQDCSPVQDIGLPDAPDATDLAATVFPCSDEAIVVSEADGESAIRSAVAASIDQQLPLFVRSDENSDDIDAALEQLGAQIVEPPSDAQDAPIEIITNLFEGNDADITYVLPATPSAQQLALLPALHATGARVAFAEPGDPDTLAQLASTGLDYQLSADFDDTDRWLASIEHELPGGGYSLFEDRRIIAFYGHPTTSALGLLGEQNAEEAVERLNAKVEEYEIDGITTIGGFEIIATIATAEPTPEGNYTRSTDPEVLRPWIEEATENDLYVILDLQPGRVDFLTQAKEYEEFLKLPNVGLALDPEWRLKPDEVHLRQIGSVDAAEVNTVVDYLSELVRANNLPQKALVLHQFRISMLENRADINTPPELAVNIHVDGQGPLGSKFSTWDTMRGDPIAPAQTLTWGWKNFIDEDTPTATPEQTNAVEPLPSIVTYQ